MKKDVDFMQAFSYFTYADSSSEWGGKFFFLVCDLEGIKVEAGGSTIYYLTDPAIHFGKAGRTGLEIAGRFGVTDFGYTGIDHFLKSFNRKKHKLFDTMNAVLKLKTPGLPEMD